MRLARSALGRVHRARPAGIAIALLLAVVAPGAGMAAPAAVLGASPALTLVTQATYDVHPASRRATVRVAITARNHKQETRTRRFFFDHAFLAVQPGATSPRITGPKGARVRVAKRTRDSTLLRIDFGSRLYSGKSANLDLAFDLPGHANAANPQVRVGTSLITLPVWAFASDGARGSTVTVRLPPGWDPAVESGSFGRRSTAADGSTVLATGALADPLSFFAFVSAQRPAAYGEQPLTLDVGGRPVELLVQAWEDDPGWAKRTGDLFARALPILREQIGLDWPHEVPMAVREAVSRDTNGYAAMFDPAANRIEVAYWADPLVAIHEAAHGWFNDSLLADRWANEGFASYYAHRAAKALKVQAKSPALTARVAAAAIPLNDWAPGPADGGASTGDGTDAFGYAASLAFATAAADRVGDDVLARVWAAAAAGRGAYQPPSALTDSASASTSSAAGVAAAEGVEGAPDWRGLLDLFEDESGTSLSDLWRTWVVRPEEAALLDARTEARASYGRTLALAGDWALPRAIRDALRAWQFDTAEQLMADARTVLAQRKALASLAERSGLELPETMQGMFEEGSLAAASARAEAERNAILAIDEAMASRSADDDILSRIGSLGEDPERDLAQAAAALAAGDTDGTLAAADHAYRAWAEAWQEGRRRALLALAVLATVIVLGSAVARGIARSRRAASAGG